MATHSKATFGNLPGFDQLDAWCDEVDVLLNIFWQMVSVWKLMSGPVLGLGKGKKDVD